MQVLGKGWREKKDEIVTCTLKDYKKESVLAPLFKMLEASFELFVPLVMAAVIDVGIAQKDRPYIVKMCFVLIALGIIGLVCSITAQYFCGKGSLWICDRCAACII